MPDDQLREIFEASWAQNAPGYRCLAEKEAMPDDPPTSPWYPLEQILEANRNAPFHARLDRRIAHSGQFPHDEQRKARPKRG